MSSRALIDLSCGRADSHVGPFLPVPSLSAGMTARCARGFPPRIGTRARCATGVDSVCAYASSTMKCNTCVGSGDATRDFSGRFRPRADSRLRRDNRVAETDCLTQSSRGLYWVVWRQRMSTESRRILKDALELPPVERADLVEELLSSFDFPARGEVDALWAKEAEDRIEAYDRGEVESRPASQVFERIDRPPTQ
jgi:putative addiction module component (TIGR02574 family)